MGHTLEPVGSRARLVLVCTTARAEWAPAGRGSLEPEQVWVEEERVADKADSGQLAQMLGTGVQSTWHRCRDLHHETRGELAKGVPASSINDDTDDSVGHTARYLCQGCELLAHAFLLQRRGSATGHLPAWGGVLAWWHGGTTARQHLEARTA